MHSETITVVISAPTSAVFNFIADPFNMPEWAIEFCQGLTEAEGIYTALTPMGEMIVNIKSDKHTGVIDMYASPDGKGDFPLATRVLPLPDGQTAYTATFFHEPGIPEAAYQQQLGSLRKEMAHMQSLFIQ